MESHLNPNEINKVAAIYTRVSSKEQVLGYSLSEQKRICKKHLEYLGIKYHRLYIDDGYSARTLNRPALQKLLNDILEGKVTHLIIWKLDRLSRNFLDTILLIEDLNRLNVEVVSVVENLDTTSIIGKMILAILSGFSQKEIEDLSRRVKIGLHARIRKGLWRGGTPPYGYHYNQDAGKLEVDDHEAVVVRMIFDQYLALQTLNRVKNHLNDHSIPSKKGGKWSPKVVRDVLLKQIYTGHYKVTDIEIEDENLRIIDDDTFHSVQELLKQRSKYRLIVNEEDCVEIYDHCSLDSIERLPLKYTLKEV